MARSRAILEAAAMISEWSSPSERIEFLAGSFGRQPYARPGAACSSIPLLEWSTSRRRAGLVAVARRDYGGGRQADRDCQAAILGAGPGSDGARHQHRPEMGC